MTEMYTPAVERVLHLARQLAAYRETFVVSIADLFPSLLMEEEGRPFQLLQQHGMSVANLRGWQAPREIEHLETRKVSHRPDLDQFLQDCQAMAREICSEPTVCTEQLLLAILRHDGELRQRLEHLGLRFAQMELDILNSIQAPPLTMEEPLLLADSTSRMDQVRILDANADRVREALRVVEDYCRFVLEDSFLSRELKQLRHDLREALAVIPGEEMLAARETLRDVGTHISTLAEQERYSLFEVVEANWKRLQEGLRSLEEFAKVGHPALGQALERMRYRSYTLERAVMLGARVRERLQGVRLYLLLTAGQCWGGLEWTVREACAGGVRAIQLREKNLPDRDLLERASKVRQWTREEGVLFLVNDRPDIARLVEADGVHLGQEDLPVREARRILGANALIGVSTHDLEQVRKAVRQGASYLGVGPLFPSTTKQFTDFPGLQFARQVAEETNLPAFALGGVNLGNLPQVLATGMERVAVSQAICGCETPRAMAAALLQLLPSSQ